MDALYCGLNGGLSTTEFSLKCIKALWWTFILLELAWTSCVARIAEAILY